MCYSPAPDSTCNTKHYFIKSLFDLKIRVDSDDKIIEWRLNKRAPLRTFVLFNLWLDVTPREKENSGRNARIVKIKICVNIINTTNKSIPWGRIVNSCSGSQNTSHILRGSKVHYRIYKRAPLLPIQGPLHPIRTHPSYSFKTHFNTIPHLRLRKTVFLFTFLDQASYALLSSPMRATCLTHLILHYLIILITSVADRSV
jgi:hypothetical protein